jgi:glycosyltransferase involved in cell wall biosynthesis
VARSLYVCYFGVREPLVRTQVIPYLCELIKDGHEVTLLTFEPEPFGGPDNKNDDEEELKRELSVQMGIEWHWLRYHKRLSALATAYDIIRGAAFIRRLIAKKRFDILHGRVHVPTLMAALARKFSRHKPKLLFDIRGFFPEEYTDAGVWPAGGILYRMAKRAERWLLKEADGFVVLTKKAQEILFPDSIETGFDRLGRPVEVIPCCVDMNRFAAADSESRKAIRAHLGLGDRFVAAYVGAFGGWYLTEETAGFFASVKRKRPDSFAMILTQSAPEIIKNLMLEKGYQESDLLITKVNPTEIPRYLCAADLAVSFIKTCYSKQASSPTKNAEYLASGLPVIANSGVGDVDAQILENRVGAVVTEFTPREYEKALDQIHDLGDIGDRCRTTAIDQFGLTSVGGVRYRRIYSNLLHKK